ncbi:hypothetical protein ACLMJK_007705 [Lecanora helva]
MSGLELALIPIALAALQLIQPCLHGIREFKRKREEQKLQLMPSDRAQGVVSAALHRDKASSQVAIAAIKSAEASSQVAIAAIKGGEVSAQVTVAAIEGMVAATGALVQESRTSRTQLLWLTAVIAYLAYALGQAHAQISHLKVPSFQPLEIPPKAPPVASGFHRHFLDLFVDEGSAAWELVRHFIRWCESLFVTALYVAFTIVTSPVKYTTSALTSRFPKDSTVISATSIKTPLSSNFRENPPNGTRQVLYAASKVATYVHGSPSVVTSYLNYPANFFYDFLLKLTSLSGLPMLVDMGVPEPFISTLEVVGVLTLLATGQASMHKLA